jgi:hypothetical protein
MTPTECLAQAVANAQKEQQAIDDLDSLNLPAQWGEVDVERLRSDLIAARNEHYKNAVYWRERVAAQNFIRNNAIKLAENPCPLSRLPAFVMVEDVHEVTLATNRNSVVARIAHGSPTDFGWLNSTVVTLRASISELATKEAK